VALARGRADDQGWNSGFHNPSLIHPHTDAVLKEGVQFAHHFVSSITSSSSLLLPSAACCLPLLQRRPAAVLQPVSAHFATFLRSNRTTTLIMVIKGGVQSGRMIRNAP
jgi:hypothetical protein